MQLPRMAAECGNAIAADGRGVPWKLQCMEFCGNCLVLEYCCGNFGGWPLNAVIFRGNCSGLTSVEVAVAIAACWRIAVAIATDGRGMPLNVRGNCSLLPWHLPRKDSRGNCRGISWHSPLIAAAMDMEAMKYAVVLPWIAMVGTTEVATDRTTARAMARTVARAVEAP